MGYRIELGEIEMAAISLDFIFNACVLYDHEKKGIVLVYESENNLVVSDIRRQLMNLVPKYMIPTIIIQLDHLPLNPNGKIDRVLLKEIYMNKGFPIEQR
jgi:acyl-coenzyme A synthetase/AMP-(fatty) acid ligase